MIMSRWSVCSKPKFKSCIIGGSDCSNQILQLMLNNNAWSLQTTRAFSRARVMFKDHYTALGVAKSATQQDIKSAYYRLSKIYHPDKNKGCEKSAELFRIATEAYEVLGNYRTRRLYDKGTSLLITSTSHFQK